MEERATKLRASVSKSHVSVDDIESHVGEQHAALHAAYGSCAMAFTETDDKYILHIQRHKKLRMTPGVVQRVLSDKYGPLEPFTRMKGATLAEIGKFSKHGGARRGVTAKMGGGDCKKDARYEEFTLSAIGQEQYTMDTTNIASALSRGDFYETIKCFGGFLQIATIENHTFIPLQRILSRSTYQSGPPAGFRNPKRRFVARFYELG